MKEKKVLEINNLSIDLIKENHPIPVVKDVSLGLDQGKVLGLIGESGCGKSLTCMSLFGLLDKSLWRVTGQANINEKNVLGLSEEAMRGLRGREIAMIMQNPVHAFDPLFTVGSHFRETIRSHKKISKKESRDMAIEMLARMGIKDPCWVLEQYPFQCSGGMLQRIMIGLALILCPEVMVADEPTTSLDLTIQYQILGQLEQLRSKYHTGILLVSHDLGVISFMADEIAVMYNGSIVEAAATDELLKNPVHPYTKALIRSRAAFRKTRLDVIEGVPPLLSESFPGCPFVPRCRQGARKCQEYDMKTFLVGKNHTVRCLCAMN